MKTRFRWTLFLAMLLSLISQSPAFSSVIHVPVDKPTIQAGIDAAASGDTVLVSPGTYFEFIDMKGGVTLRSETGLPNCATIDGGGLSVVIRFPYLVEPSRLEGFTIRGGISGGMYVFDSEVEIRSCIITGNQTATHGGGIYCRNSTLTLIDCIVSNNSTRRFGGGVCAIGTSNLVMEGCKVVGNTTDTFGGGLHVSCPAIISDCTFERNSAGIDGGGVWSVAEQSFDTCTFMGNSAQRDGGGVMVDFYSTSMPSPELTRCAVFGNTTIDGSGGGIACRAQARIWECLIVDNMAGKSGGGMYCIGSEPVEVNHCTIVGNSAVNWGGGIYSYSTGFQVTASIIAFSREGEGIYCYGGGPGVEISLCDIFGNKGGDQLCGMDRGGNFSADPLFCNVASGNFFLAQESPCLIGADPYYFVIGAKGLGDCSLAPVDDSPSIGTFGREFLGQNHPNPFNPRTLIPIDLKEPGRPHLRIFDLAGRQVKTLLNGNPLAAGRTEVPWDGRDGSGNRLPSGIYFYHLEVGGFSETKRMLMMK